MANLTLCLASILLTIAAVEGGLRITHYGVQFRPTEHPGFFPRSYHVPDATNGYDINPDFPATNVRHPDYFEIFGVPYTVSSNELGCRDRHLGLEDRYVLLLGDSFTWALVPFEHAFGTLVEQLIGMRVLKCGVAGYGTRQEHNKLKKVVNQQRSPSLIIVGYWVGNDLIDDYLYPEGTVLEGYLVSKTAILNRKDGETITYTDQELREKIRPYLDRFEPTNGVWLLTKDFLSKHLYTYNLMKNSIYLRYLVSKLGLGEPPNTSLIRAGAIRTAEASEIFHSLDEYPWLREAWTAHLNYLRQLKQSADEMNAKLLVVIIPTREQVYEYLRPSGGLLDWEYPNRRLNEYFEKEGISVFDLLPEFRSYANPKPKLSLDPVKDLYWSQDYHLNIKGNQLAGLLISRYLLEQTFLEAHNKTKRLSNIKDLLISMQRETS
jgi:hypothetical protein